MVCLSFKQVFEIQNTGQREKPSFRNPKPTASAVSLILGSASASWIRVIQCLYHVGNGWFVGCLRPFVFSGQKPHTHPFGPQEASLFAPVIQCGPAKFRSLQLRTGHELAPVERAAWRRLSSTGGFPKGLCRTAAVILHDWVSRIRRPAANPLNRYRVPILERALDLVEMLTAHPDGLTLTGMTECIDMPKNAIFRIAATLTLRGYVERDEVTKVYRLSRKLLAVSQAALGSDRFVQVAGPILKALRDATGETALLGILSGAQGIVLDQVPSSHPVKVVVEIGHAFPLHTAAPAKAMLAYWEPASQKAFVQQIKFTKRTRRTITSSTAYLAELRKTRQAGYAFDRGEESETFACVAAPVFDHRGHPVVSIWISGPSDRMTPAKLKEFGPAVRKFADQLSRQLGHQA
jgi:DNA-binding IclR family transcriptional regulator